MSGIWILVLIGWVVLTAVGKKKKAEAQEAERRHRQAEAAARAEAAQGSVASAPAPAAVPKTAYEVFPRQAPPMRTPAPAPAPAQARAQRAPVRPGLQPTAGTQAPVKSRLTDISANVTKHVVEASSVSGHAHEETSLTGVRAECEPEQARRASAPATAAPAAGTPFHWDAGAVRSGVVMAEILGKPKALRGAR